jgi:hypothetical protein
MEGDLSQRSLDLQLTRAAIEIIQQAGLAMSKAGYLIKSSKERSNR